MTDDGRRHAERLDDADPLRSFRDEFVIADDGLVYFDGNSLGRLPRRTATRLAEVVVDEWGGALVRGWRTWVDLPTLVGDRLGAAVLGAGPGQVVVCDNTTVNLYKLLTAALDARPGRATVVTDRANFPTDRYVLEGLATARGLTVRWVDSATGELDLADAAAGVAEALGPDVAVATFSVVDYRTAAIADVAGITAAARRAGVLVVWDLSHAAGAIQVDLDGWGVDLAVGCTYKYLNAGPGAPAWLYVRHELQDQLVPPVWGWFAQEDQFAMGPTYRPVAGIRRWLTGSPPVLGIAAVDEGVAILEAAGMAAVRAKAVALTSYAAELAAEWLGPLGFTVGSPLDASRRGSHLALRHPAARRLSEVLVEEAGVVPDFREPDVLRIGLSPLTTRYTEVWDGFDRIRTRAAAL